MTEPPEPRDPTEGGGEDEPEEVPGMDELLDSEWLDEMEDDLLLDQLGRGEDNRTLYDAPDDDDLQDAAHDWREGVEETPLPKSTHPEAIMAEHERRKKAAEPPAPRAPHPKGTANPMSLQDSIATLHGVAGETSAAGPLNSVQQTLTGTVLPAAQQSVERLAELVDQARTATEGNDNATQEVGSTGEHAANAIEEVIDAVNSAIQAVTLAIQHEQQFRNTCGDTGNRLAG